MRDQTIFGTKSHGNIWKLQEFKAIATDFKILMVIAPRKESQKIITKMNGVIILQVTEC
jgi:hypothetical protein